MSRKSRLEALRARRAAGITGSPPEFEPYVEPDYSLGLPHPVITEPLEPIPAPKMRGQYVTCGGCGSFIGSTMSACQRCAGVL